MKLKFILNRNRLFSNVIESQSYNNPKKTLLFEVIAKLQEPNDKRAKCAKIQQDDKRSITRAREYRNWIL